MGRLLVSALAMFAPRPAAGPTLAFFELLLGPANATLAGRLLLGILDPADEFVARQGCDVLPGSECRGIGDQRLAQVCGQLVHHPTGHSLAAHGSQRNPMCQAVFRQSVHNSSLLTSDEGASYMGGCSVSAELPVPQDLGRWGAHANSHSLCGPR